MIKIICFGPFLFFISFLQSQTLENDFYRFKLPPSFDSEKIDGSQDTLASIDLYTIRNSEEVFVIQLMSNKLNYAITKITENNYDQFLQDFVNINILDHKVLELTNNDFYEVKFEDNKNSKIVCFGYLKILNDIIYRIIILYPQKIYSENIYSSGLSLLKTVEFKNHSWPTN